MGAEIAQAVDDNYNLYFPTSKSASFVQKSRSAWENLAKELNAQHSGSAVNWEQLRDKYKNMKKTVKKDFVEEKKSGTSGGSAMVETDPSKLVIKESILKTFQNKASFTGVPGGVSTGIHGDTYPKAAETVFDQPNEEDMEVKELMSKKAQMIGKSVKSDKPTMPSEKSLEDLQREVLQVELENSRKLSPILDKVNTIIDRVSPVPDSSDEDPSDPSSSGWYEKKDKNKKNKNCKVQ